MGSVSLSPDGNKIALMKIPTKDGMPILEIYDANNLSAKPFKMDADPMEMVGFDWVTSNHIIFTARLKVRDMIDGWNEGVYDYAGGLLTLNKDPKKSKSTKISDNFSVRGILPNKPNKVLIQVREKTGTKASSVRSRVSSFYEYDVRTGRRKLITKSAGAVRVSRFDIDGNPRFGQAYDGATNSYEQYYREFGSSKWELIHSQHREDFQEWRAIGMDSEIKGNILVLANNGKNTQGLWSFNPKTKVYDELIYRRADVDVGIRRHTNVYTNGEEITAVSYRDGRETKYEWFNGEEKALYEQLKSIIPHADGLFISDRTEDGNSMVVFNVGPRDPGTYYLLKNGKLDVIGSSYPQFAGDKLADVEAITYTARDGKKIPGFITIPNSKPPYPLVVMPHGGPFVRESVYFDQWAQLLANRGYMVLQPQYRGSKGYGLDFYTTAFINGGQGGYQMQDDKDDGALYLAEQGLADRDRMMMFGWSYGGYAALVAATRTPQIYQCVIAGAAVPDPNDQISYYRNNMAGFSSASAIEQLAMWDDSIHPIKEVAKVNVPMLVIHGDVDQRTPPRAARAYLKALEKHEKPHKKLWLEGADHFSSSLFYRHKMAFYTALTDYLENDCFAGNENLAAK
jgi:dipeptidyl aminopeptidase/acylaminoacyl peptidase